MTNYTLGIDLSAWQDKQVNWTQAISQGVRFAYIRGAYGVTKDTLFDLHWGSSKRKVYRGVYLYFRDGQDPIQQAQNLYNFCAAHGDFGELPPVLDIEEYGNTQITPSKVKACLEKLEQLFGVKPLVYTAKAVWDKWFGNVSWAREYDLWCSNPPYTQWFDTLIETVKSLDPALWPKKPLPWQGLMQLFWQITFEAPASQYGVSGTKLDLNLFSGTEAELADYANGTITPPPPDPEPEPTPIGNDVMQKMKCVTLGGFINIRARPTANSLDVGNFGKNELAYHFPAKKVVVKAELPNKEIWRAGLFADGTLGYVAEWHPTLKNASGQQYAAIIDIEPPEPCGEGVPMTPEQEAALNAVITKTNEHTQRLEALEDAPPSGGGSDPRVDLLTTLKNPTHKTSEAVPFESSSDGGKLLFLPANYLFRQHKPVTLRHDRMLGYIAWANQQGITQVIPGWIAQGKLVAL